jgi:hypothetical protein
MRIHTVDPLTDPRWSELLQCHPAASVFHSPAWLRALQRTYGYSPLVATTCAPGARLTNGIAFCRVDSFVTRRRLVSVPFSDHCEPLAESADALGELLAAIPEWSASANCNYVELRPLATVPSAAGGFGPTGAFFMHVLPLPDAPADAYRRFSRDCIQRKIRKAEREKLSYEEGNSERLIGHFYGLQLLTRRRHHLPPQPLNWFRELAAVLGDSMKIRVAFHGAIPIASIITLEFKRSMVYKYGCSNAAYHHMGGLQMLFWNAIQEAIAKGLCEFDLGRSDIDNDGLATFKDRWGAPRSLLSYWSSPPVAKNSHRIRAYGLAGPIFRHIPDKLLLVSGRLLYRHVG